MITLYVKTNCPFSAKAIAVLDAYNVPYEKKNIKDAVALTELMSLGGKKQTPFLVDGDAMIYESQSIIEYVERKYGTETVEAKKPRIHFTKGTDVCTL